MLKIKKIRKYLITNVIILGILMGFSFVYASSEIAQVELNEYTKSYSEYLKSSETEQKSILIPNKYGTEAQKDNITYINSLNNVIKSAQLLKSSLSTKYSLKDIIANNVKIRNQQQTNTCWDFATIASLESNLAFLDNKNSKTETIYDFSERHMDYATAYSAFLNSKTNSYGFARMLSNGGNFIYALSYLMNGMGVINEADMPFENNQNNIDISSIENKSISATVLDTKNFSTPTTDVEKANLTKEMKEYISNYGGIYAGVYANSDYASSDYYNINTGAMYSTNQTPNHAVCIIGWDDDYDKTNFNTKNQPASNGAWVVKNSWGDFITKDIEKFKTEYYDSNTATCNSNGWNSSSEVPNDTIISNLKSRYGESKVTLLGTTITIEVGDKGYMYISYEDTTIYSNLHAISNSETGKNYYKLYEDDVLGEIAQLKIIENKIYIANVFQRDSTNNEKLYRVSVYTPQSCNCKIYINSKDNNKSLSDLEQVALTTGDTVTIEPGFHTLQLATPVVLSGTSFVIAAELTPKDTTLSNITISLEKPNDNLCKNVIVNSNESFIATEAAAQLDSTWEDLKTKVIIGSQTVNGNLIIKAYTEQYTPSSENNNGNNSGTNTGNTTENNTTNETSNTNSTNTTNENANTTKPTSSDFSNTQANITESATYYNTSDNTDYTTMSVKVDNIKIGNENDTYTYYYYISATQGDTNISSEYWTKINSGSISKQSDGTYSILLNINTSELKNISKLTASDNLYLYLKEIASINSTSIQNIATLTLTNTSTTTYYVNGIKANSSQTIINNDENKDITTTTGKIPQTGDVMIVTLIASIVTIIGIIACILYVRYKRLISGK